GDVDVERDAARAGGEREVVQIGHVDDHPRAAHVAGAVHRQGQGGGGGEVRGGAVAKAIGGAGDDVHGVLVGGRGGVGGSVPPQAARGVVPVAHERGGVVHSVGVPINQGGPAVLALVVQPELVPRLVRGGISDGP